MAVYTYRFGITGSTICDGCSVCMRCLARHQPQSDDLRRQASYHLGFRFRASAPEGTLMPNRERLLQRKYNSASNCNDSVKRKADSQGVGLFLCLVEALDQLWTKTPAFCGPESALDSARATESTRFMVGAVGIELLLNFTKSRVSTVLPTVNQMNWSQMELSFASSP
jgi:hypothetical protein